MIIGLTGSIASGKSTVSKMLKEKGYPIVDADEIARLVVEPGSPTLLEIQQQFGMEFIREDGSLNRERLGEWIFTHPAEREKLNGIIHPAIRKEMLSQKEKWIAAGAGTIIMDIPLLFESKLESYVEKILVVSVTPEVQLRRLMDRNVLSEEEAKKRIQSQIPVADKEKRADAIIHNNGTLAETERQLNTLIEAWNI
ncbi:dephospho-CoA kinase [Sporosarcina sp. HYO08]|uniref:dephospho-CoA kinase n=1 Tax=Sporosarcina sp. HYO08 TaxID=1759557 RepID=UPI000793D3DE|nr:dephospho-CoA kinase [Sporosarcina sp. HYO08]KXH87209.1 dephospho-CoA kinase [Sporosarcina sp. HYO08]